MQGASSIFNEAQQINVLQLMWQVVILLTSVFCAWTIIQSLLAVSRLALIKSNPVTIVV